MIHLLGKEYKLTTRLGNSEFAYTEDDKLIVEYKKEEHIGLIINKLYAEILERIISRYSDKLCLDFKLKFKPVYKIKNTKSYFGKCFIKQKLIVLSTLLAKYEEKYIISVLYHEFTHFYVSNHQKEFYDFIEKMYPNYKKVDGELKCIKYADLY